MNTPIALAHMSTEEKLAAMELLWEGLSRSGNANLSPAWHADELATRAAALKHGDERVEDWDDAKARIRIACK